MPTTYVYVLAGCAAFLGLLLTVFSEGPYEKRTRNLLFLTGLAIVVASIATMMYVVRPH